jgi:sugar phosphate isomerase/epimerase
MVAGLVLAEPLGEDALMQSLGPTDVVLCSATLGRNRPWVDKLAAAASAGFTAVSVYVWEYQAARQAGHSDADLRAMLRHHGLAVAEVDGASRWLPGHFATPPAGASPLYEIDDFVTAATALGARSLTVHDTWGLPIADGGEGAAADAFASVCDRVATVGLIAHIEFFPWSGIDNMATAWSIVEQAGRPNGGIILDTWHLFRGPDKGRLPDGVPGSVIVGLQINDAPPTSTMTVRDECVHARLLPGDGAIDVVTVLREVRRRGSTAPVGVEVFSDELDLCEPADAARAVMEATRAVLAS